MLVPGWTEKGGMRMMHQRFQGRRIDYRLFRYGSGRLQFRGPCPDMDQPYIAFVGGAETFAPGAERPFADLVSAQLPYPVLNLGQPGAGPDLYLGDPLMQVAVARAQAVVVAAPSACYLSNRLYRVHPRRNDRLIEGLAPLRARYPAIDLSDVTFAGHLCRVLFEADPHAFLEVMVEIKTAWVARVRTLLRLGGRRSILLWAATTPPADPLEGNYLAQMDMHPAFVDQDMMDDVSVEAGKVVECVTRAPLLPADVGGGGAYVAPNDRRADAALRPAHQDVAQSLVPVLSAILGMA